MKLSCARPGCVVRNTNNNSFYRFERIERGKARIFPLELFPNGLLIAKPTPTLVEPDLDVTAIGEWRDDLVVQGSPSRSRPVYENELVKLEGRLVELQAAYDELPRGGTGKLSRGSWANKVKNCHHRIQVLKRGLGFVEGEAICVTDAAPANSDFLTGQLVQVPSGRPAKVMGFQPMGDSTYVNIALFMDGRRVDTALPPDVLRPWALASVCTV